MAGDLVVDVVDPPRGKSRRVQVVARQRLDGAIDGRLVGVAHAGAFPAEHLADQSLAQVPGDGVGIIIKSLGDAAMALLMGRQVIGRIFRQPDRDLQVAGQRDQVIFTVEVVCCPCVASASTST